MSLFLLLSYLITSQIELLVVMIVSTCRSKLTMVKRKCEQCKSWSKT